MSQRRASLSSQMDETYSLLCWAGFSPEIVDPVDLGFAQLSGFWRDCHLIKDQQFLREHFREFHSFFGAVGLCRKGLHLQIQRSFEPQSLLQAHAGLCHGTICVQ